MTTSGKACLSVPSTQNTAPVIKYRCLYTHDIRRKAKRWQDGFLRYHTFNKRAMVYDDIGNFIGDLHRRQDGELQDGDELELDKGVLIQVGECMEKTQTDVSSLFETKRITTSQQSPQNRVTSTKHSRILTAVHSATPVQTSRSLNELLGIKKTSPGSLLTPKTPYEARQLSFSAESSHVDMRSTKRARILPAEDCLGEKSTNSPIDTCVAAVNVTKERNNVLPRRKESDNSLPGRKLPKPVGNPTNTSDAKTSGNVLVEWTTLLPQKQAQEVPAEQPQLMSIRNGKGFSASGDLTPVSMQQLNSAPAEVPRVVGTKELGNRKMISSAHALPASRSFQKDGSEHKRMNALRIATEKRNKLMYQALPSPTHRDEKGSSNALPSRHRSNLLEKDP